MEGLSIEEKAKRYDEALKVLHKYDGANIMFSQSLKEEMFPELKESERIIKELIKFINDKVEQGGVNAEQFVKYKSWINWLEKQDEHANFRNKIQIGDEVTRNEDGMLVNLSQLKRVAKPTDKQCEQKPVVETKVIIPKFRVGDIVKSKSQPMFSPRKIISIGKDCYWCEDRGCIGFAWEDDCEIVEQKSAEWSEEDEKMYTATIFALAGFMGNEDKLEWLKSLKDRVQPNQEWSEEDDEHLERILKELENQRQRPINIPCLDKIESDYNWLKSLKNRYTWKPSDLPHWKKSTLPDSNTTGFNSDYFCHKGYCINYKELFEKLPKDD